VSAVAENFWATLPLGRGVKVLVYDANGVAALDKPAGVLSHPNESKDQPRSLVTCHYDAATECYAWTDATGALGKLWLLNRLDSATSGVILVATDGALASEIRAQFKRKSVSKIYQALVFGIPRPPQETWRDLLAVTKKAGQIRTAANAGNIPAESRMQVVRSRPGAGAVALIQLEPRTGRSHQLRVQCAKRNLPIVGDQTYGDFRRNREFAKRTGEKRLFLHSLQTRFDYEWHGRRFSFTALAPLPGEFVAEVQPARG
jgi:23S rRNA-/tRNA-specific pseudouridylate synthase